MDTIHDHPHKIHTTEQPIAVIREQVPMDSLSEFFGRAFGQVMDATQSEGISPAGPPFARYHGMPGTMVDVEAGFPVSGTFTENHGVLQSVLPETDAFEAIHVGPFDTLEETYGRIQREIEAEGLRPADTMWEYYLSDPEDEPDPSRWRTRVVWPVE